MAYLLRGVVKVRALSNVVSVIILMVILLAVFVPTLLYFQSLQYNQPISTAISNEYMQLKSLQEAQIQYGHPSFYYNGSQLILEYSNGTFVPPLNVTIVGILYLNPQTGVWTNVTTLKYPITVSKDQALQLPSYVKGLPIIVVTSLGNIFFLTSGSSIGPYSGVVSKGGTIVLAQICQSSGPLSVSTNVTTDIYGTWQNFTTPVTFPNQTGTFAMKVPEYVYYENSKGQIITGVFHNWKVLGVASLNSTTSNSVQVTLAGFTTVIIANYTTLLAYDQVQIVPSVNGVPITLSIDGNSYTIQGPTTLNLTAGYANLTVITTQFNSTPSNGVIHHYSYSNVTYGNNVYKTLSMLLFLPPQSTPTVYLNYVNDYNYYNVTIKWQAGQGYLIAVQSNGLVVATPISYPGVEVLGGNSYPYVSFYHAIAFNGTVYQFNQSFWLKGGTYVMSPLGQFAQVKIPINLLTYYLANFTVYSAVLKLYYQNGSESTYYYPDLPSLVAINQPITIVAIYNVTDIDYYL